MGGKRKGGKLSSKKARTILKDGSVKGHKLSARQRGYFGLIAGGGTPRKSGGRKR